MLVFKTKIRFTRRHPQFHQDLHANYTTFTEFLESETGKFMGKPLAGSYFYVRLYRNQFTPSLDNEMREKKKEIA